jgi:hypothetical protein
MLNINCRGIYIPQPKLRSRGDIYLVMRLASCLFHGAQRWQHDTALAESIICGICGGPADA